MIGLCGAHGTGKTELARTFSELSGMYLLQANVPRMTTDYCFYDHLFLHEEIMNDLERKYRAAPTPFFVTDYTPIDVYGSLLSDVPREGLAEPYQKAVDLLWKQALEICNSTFRLMFLLQPHDPANADPYMEHLNAIMVGLMMGKGSPELNCSLVMAKPQTTNLQERAEILLRMAKHNLPQYMFLEENCAVM